MKTKILVPVFLAFVMLSDLKAQQFKAGLTAGAVASDIPGTDTRDNDVDYNKLGFTAGLLVTTSLNPRTSLQMELNYVQKGTSQPPDSLNQGSFKLILNYVEVPLIIRRRLHFTVFKKESTNFELEAGASYGRIFGMKYYDQTNYQQILNPGAFNLSDISLIGGIEFHITPSFIFCLRYTNSVIPAIKTDPLPSNFPHTTFVFYTFNHGDNVVIQMTLKFIFGPVGNNSPANQ